ncbi:MAG: metallophosphoesterase [Ignavibacteria bacterium]|nr:metallophosphoesterase [Ignavibacteria bacterium]
MSFLHRSLLVLFFFVSFIFYSCKEENALQPLSENVKIIVFSDPHLYDPSLGTTGEAFEKYLASDRKLIAESDAILQAMISKIEEEKPDLVLVPGDLTKDGEKINHEKLANYFGRLKRAGIKVLVVPGNHDINNPQSYRYSGAQTIKIPTVTPEEFKQIYRDCGYGNALEFAPNSLTYLAEPINGLWIFGIDVTIHDNNVESSVTAGRLKNSDLIWMKKKLAEAKSKGKIVLAFAHHAFMEHFSNQATFFSDYVIADWFQVSQQLADAGLKVVFTGHFHSHDITKYTTTKGNTLYDISTGSTVTFPCPYRVVELSSDGKMNIKSYKIEKINCNLGTHATLTSYSKANLESGLKLLIPYMLMNQFNLPQDKAITYGKEVGPILIPAILAHFSGDEQIPQGISEKLKLLKQSQDLVVKTLVGIVEAFLTDLPPADNDVIIDLNNGNIAREYILKINHFTLD